MVELDRAYPELHLADKVKIDGEGSDTLDATNVLQEVHIDRISATDVVQAGEVQHSKQKKRANVRLADYVLN